MFKIFTIHMNMHSNNLLAQYHIHVSNGVDVVVQFAVCTVCHFLTFELQGRVQQLSAQ